MELGKVFLKQSALSDVKEDTNTNPRVVGQSIVLHHEMHFSEFCQICFGHLAKMFWFSVAGNPFTNKIFGSSQNSAAPKWPKSSCSQNRPGRHVLGEASGSLAEYVMNNFQDLLSEPAHVFLHVRQPL